MRTKEIIKLIDSRFNMYYGTIGAVASDSNTDFLRVLKEYLVAYFGMPLEVLTKKVNVEIDLFRHIRECLEISINVTDVYVSNPTIIEIKKELKGYTMIVKIRGLDHHKMLEIARLANELIEPQDPINYGEEE